MCDVIPALLFNNYPISLTGFVFKEDKGMYSNIYIHLWNFTYDVKNMKK